MPLSRSFSRRLALVGVLGAAAAISSCDTALSFRPEERLWGFVNANATKTSAGDLRVAPTGVFFRGVVSQLPNAAFRPDSCDPARAYTPSTNTLTGVRYLDAGESVGLTLGGSSSTIPRISNSGVTTYQLAAGSTLGYRPGDSVVFRVPGATGGYPAVELRGKTAEALTVQPLTPPTTGYMQFRWGAASDTNSAIFLQLLWAPAGGSGALSREIRCAFRDDGVDSISLGQYQEWATATNVKREVVVTRLRTILKEVSGGAIHFISTFQVPTPTP